MLTNRPVGSYLFIFLNEMHANIITFCQTCKIIANKNFPRHKFAHLK